MAGIMQLFYKKVSKIISMAQLKSKTSQCTFASVTFATLLFIRLSCIVMKSSAFSQQYAAFDKKVSKAFL